MKTLATLALMGILAIVHQASGQTPGGFRDASVKDKQVVDAAQFAIKARQQVMTAAGDKEKLTLVKITAAQQQVVQGMNYRLTLQVKVGETEKTATADVWVRLWLKADEQYKLTAWKFAGDEKPAEKPSIEDCK